MNQFFSVVNSIGNDRQYSTIRRHNPPILSILPWFHQEDQHITLQTEP